MNDTPIQITERAPGRLLRTAEVNRFGGQICDKIRMRIAPTPAPKRHHCGARRNDALRSKLENEHRQLIERVDRLQPNQEEHRDHQVRAEMHRRDCNRRLLAAHESRRVCKSNSVSSGNHARAANTRPRDSNRKASAAAEVIRSSRTSSTGGLLFDASFLPVYVPWKILIPHSTTTMADIRVAAVNTLSMEATLIPLSASQPRQRSR